MNKLNKNSIIKKIQPKRIQFKNSIIWGNNGVEEEEFHGGGTYSYSIVGDYTNTENNVIDEDPLFTDANGGDYTLILPDSPCYNSGEYDLWNLDDDLDGSTSTADMGATGGSSILPNFTEHDFGEVGDIARIINFTLHNFGDNLITIESVLFSVPQLTTNTEFPPSLFLHPGYTKNIEITYLPGEAQVDMNATMTINSPDELIDGLSVALSGIGSNGDLLGGELSGTIEGKEYRITSDLSVGYIITTSIQLTAGGILLGIVTGYLIGKIIKRVFNDSDVEITLNLISCYYLNN